MNYSWIFGIIRIWTETKVSIMTGYNAIFVITIWLGTVVMHQQNQAAEKSPMAPRL